MEEIRKGLTLTATFRLFMVVVFTVLCISCASSKELYEERSKRIMAERDAAIRGKNNEERLCEERSRALVAERGAAIRERDGEVLLRKELETVIERQKNEIVSLKQTIDSFRQSIQKAEITNILECQAQLEGCRALKEEAEKKAYSNGMLAIWEALSVSVIPDEKGWVFKDYYLTVSVRVRGRNVYDFRVKTAESYPPFSKTLSAAADFATVYSLVR